MNIGTEKPKLTPEELDRVVDHCLRKAVSDKLIDANTVMLMKWADQMNQHAQTVPERGTFDRPKGNFILKSAIPQDLHGLLMEMKPDGMKQYDNNLDFMGWFKQQPAFRWLKEKFPLCDRKWEDIA